MIALLENMNPSVQHRVIDRAGCDCRFVHAVRFSDETYRARLGKQRRRAAHVDSIAVRHG